MFNPWANFNPSQPFPMWGQPPAAPPNFNSPVFAQLFDLGQFMQSMQSAMQNQAPGGANMAQLEELIRTFSSAPMLGALPGATLPKWPPWTNQPDLNSLMPPWGTSIPDAPALGITREYQESFHQLSRQRQDCDAAMRAFGELFHDFARRASENFANTAMAKDSEPDFDVLCRKWIDCCEKEFQAIAQTPEFSTRLGDVINSQLKMMQLTHRLQEEMAKLQGQPTRGELDSLRRQNTQAQVKIDALEKRLQQLESSQRKPAKRAPRKPRTTRKS